MSPDAQLPACSGCAHAALVHDIGTRRGQRVRTSCLHGEGPTGATCPCKQYARPAEATP